MHQTVETPPPPAPRPRPDSFQTTSCPELLKLVPPTPMTYGASAGLPALTVSLAVVSVLQPVEPLSPAAAKIDWPWALACSYTVSSESMNETGRLASQLPQDTESVLSVSEVANFW